MRVVSPMKGGRDGRRKANLRQGDHSVAAEWRPAPSRLGAGSTVRVEIISRRAGAELAGIVTADDHTVNVTIQDRGRERVRRVYFAPRLTEVELLERAMDDRTGDRISTDTLAMAGRLLAEPETPPTPTERGEG
jgi:hypothetical protein